jgi:hypothetical protein
MHGRVIDLEIGKSVEGENIGFFSICLALVFIRLEVLICLAFIFML